MSSPNVTYQVKVGDVWAYNDDGVWVEWAIDTIHMSEGVALADMTKLTGPDQGFRAKRYPINGIANHRLWKYVRGQATPDVTFSCPHCGQNKPIKEGDYLCVDCRQTLDNEG